MNSDATYDLSDRAVLITGGSRGIGRALAEGFAEAGADVVIASRKHDICETVAAEISSRTGRRAVGMACHVGKWDEIERLADRVYEEFGRCDVLINNAGMTPAYPDLISVTEEYYDKVSQVNLKGPFRLCAIIGTRMAEGDGGSIINISSTGALKPGADELVYGIAKAGLNALTVGLAGAFGPKVRVNALLPGLVTTDLSSQISDSQRAALIAETPLSRAGEPGDYVGPALWLASTASDFVTGALIRVDGGAARQL